MVGEYISSTAGAIGCSDDGTGYPNGGVSAMLNLPPFSGREDPRPPEAEMSKPALASSH